MVGIQRRFLVVLAFFALLAVPAAHADVQTTGIDNAEERFSTRETTCSVANACEGPSLRGRIEVGGSQASAELPEAQCAKQLVDTKDPSSEECEHSLPEVDPGVARVYVGLQSETQDQDRNVDTQGSQAAPADEGGMDPAMAAALGAGALGLGATGAVALIGMRRVFTFLLAPLAARLQKSELLEDETRRGLYKTIRQDPGINLRALADELDLAWGTLLHHLHKLEKAHLITTKRYGKYRRCFLNGSTYSADEKERLAALSTPSTARVAEYILDNPGATQSEIGDALGVTASTVLWHARRLKEVELLETRREGRYVRYFPQLHDHEVQALAA